MNGAPTRTESQPAGASERGCSILAHDAQMDEFLDAARIGRVVIHDSCHIGARAIILPGVEIGPRTIVGAGSVVITDIDPGTVAVGNPAYPVKKTRDLTCREHPGERVYVSR